MTCLNEPYQPMSVERVVAIPSTRAYELRSAVNGRDYRLFITLPERYSADNSTRYPVLYVLDGNGSFPIATEAHRLKEEVIPFVDARLRTTSDRGLWGHSFGGLFALYVLFEQPELFARYAINSPSLWWNQRESIAREAAYARTHDSLPAHVFLSFGADEGPELFSSFVSTLKGRGHRRLELSSHVFEGETHASVVPATFSRSFRFLYPKPTRP